MKDLKESLLNKTSKKIRNMSNTIKHAQLEQLGFPEFDEDSDRWVWHCPDIVERNKDAIYRLTKRNRTYCGFWMEVIPAVFQNTKKEVFSVSIEAITDRKGDTPWMGNRNIITLIVERDMKVAYEFFQLFALNVDEMLKDFVKLGDDYIIKDVYPMMMEKYGK